MLLIEFCTSVIFLAFWVLSCLGWGDVIYRCCCTPVSSGEKETSPVLLPAAGFAFLVIAGGLFNLLGFYSNGLMALVIGLGTLAHLAKSFLTKASWQIRCFSPECWFFAGGLVFLCVLWLLMPPEFNGSDDGPAYMAFAQKLAQTGSSGYEPFSERRLFSLGASMPFQSLIGEILGTRWLSVLEPCVGLVVTALIIVSAWVTWGTPCLVSGVVLGFLFLSPLLAKPVSNLAPAYALLPCLVAVMLNLLHGKTPKKTEEVFTALTIGFSLAASVAFRTTALPLCGLLGLWVWINLFRNHAYKGFIVLPVAFIAGFTPFALNQLLASETLLFPFLGKGVHASHWAEMVLTYNPKSFSERIIDAVQIPFADSTSLIFIATASACIFFLLKLPSERSILKPFVLLAAIALVTQQIIIYGTDGVVSARYTFPFIMSAALALSTCIPIKADTLLELAQRMPVLRFLFPIRSRIYLISFALFICITMVGAWVLAPTLSRKLAPRMATLQPSSARIESIKAAQNAVSSGKTLLVTSELAYLMDFKRNPILLHDQPGAAAAEHGWPQSLLAKPSEQLSYLRSVGIDYILVDQSFIHLKPAKMTTPPDRYTMAERFNAFILSEAMASRILYKDDFLRVLSTAQ